MDWVYPRHERLAMGGTHSVHIIMSINLQAFDRLLIAGKALLGQPQLQTIEVDVVLCEPCAYTAEDGMEDDVSLESDAEWVRKAKVKMQCKPGAQAFYGDTAAGHTPMDPREFAKRCREARTTFSLVFVVLYLFAGVPRSGDIEEHFRSEAALHALDFIFCSVDLLTSADWDLSQPWLFDLL